MHIPDGFLDLKTSLGAGVLAAGALAVALRDVKRTLPPRQTPLLGLAAAFIFAGQMLNFPVAGGTSGHLVGAVLAAALLGPGAAVIVMSAVLIVQCLVFADGGVLALGANIFNMGVVGGVLGGLLYRLVRSWMGDGLRSAIAAAAFAGWCSTVLAATCCAGMLAMSGMARWSVVFPAMASVHMLIGVGESLITALVLTAVGRARPELLLAPARPADGLSYRAFIGYGVCVAAGLALFLSPFASQSPDGLERVAEQAGFAGAGSHAAKVLPSPPLAEYSLPGIGSPAMATALAGLIGTGIVFVLALWVSRWLTPTGPRGKGAVE
jgi:cobalt/nickel transport system permease protein